MSSPSVLIPSKMYKASEVSTNAERERIHESLSEEVAYSSVWSQSSYKHVTHSLGLGYTLILWRGSIWQFIWKELSLWLLAYGGLSIMYRNMDVGNRHEFLAWCNYCDTWSTLISTPMAVALGFFVTQVFSRPPHALPLSFSPPSAQQKLWNIIFLCLHTSLDHR